MSQRIHPRTLAVALSVGAGLLAGPACQTSAESPDPATAGASSEIGQASGQSALLSGMHDIQSAAFMQGATAGADKGWITDLQFIGSSGSPTVDCHASAIAAGISIIQRLDVDTTHSFPDASGRSGYVNGFAAYVTACPQIHVWIVGNEPNITVGNSDPSVYAAPYAAAYVAVRSRVHGIPGHEGDFVLMSPASPFSPNCICSMRRIIQQIVAQGGQPDGFAVHAYTQATTFSAMVAAVTSEDTQADPCGMSFHKNFRIYRDWIAAIVAENQSGKPVFITEAGNVWASGGAFCPGTGCYPNQNLGYFRAMYQEVAAYNAANPTTKIRAVTLYRWADFSEPQSTPFAISTRPMLQPDVTSAFAANLQAPLTCDNNVVVGNTACNPSDPAAEFVCTNPDGSSTSQWTRHPCAAGQTCSGTQCGTGGSSCPYGSIQSRVQQNAQQPWSPAITIALGQSFTVGAFHDGSGQLVSCCTSIRVTGPSGFTSSPGNLGTVTPPSAGTYQVTATCGSIAGTATVTVTGGSCSCGGGSTFWGTPVPASDTSCGFQVCGSDNQRYSCLSDGWHAAGNSPCNCRCTGGADVQGRPINPDYTFCGYTVCGMDHQHYTCTAGGWSAQHDSCN